MTLNTATGKAGKADKPGMKRRREPENSPDNVDIDDSKIGDTVFPGNTFANGPTSFAGLIPSTSAATQGTRPARKIRTFHDVSGAAAAGATSLKAVPLSQSDWLPPIMAPRPPKAGGAADAQAGQLGQQTAASTAAAAQLSGITLEEPPMDWSLKTSLRFTSSHPFTIVDTARTAPRSEVIDAERSFTACIGDTGLNPHQRLLAAAMTWQFPQNPQPPASSRPIETSVPSHIQQRRKDWQESLSSLYDALRTRQCSAFYAVSPQIPSGIGRQPFTVLFSVAGLKGNERLQAVMGTSSAGVRSMLKMQGVEFETPLVTGGSTTSATATGRSTTASDHTTRSMLLFNGALQVHALFDFLLNRAFTLLDSVCDVPLLLAPVQFTHAAIKKYTLTATAASAAVASGTRKGARKGQVNTSKTLHTLDVKGGMIPGWVAVRLLRVLTSEDSLSLNNNKASASTADSTAVTMLTAPFPASVALNWHVSNPPTGKLGNVSLSCIGGCTSDEEATRWSTTLEGLDTAAVREIKFTCGVEGGKGEKEANRKYQIMQTTTRILPVNL